MSDFISRIKANDKPFLLDGGFGSLICELGGSLKSGENNHAC